ncbi:MAG: helix-turn-helix domain-containing protein, partial [Bacteroidales bacterium]|nr:helix-turn-helix domain-containing protein [Bacteroidales bacterium]
MKKNENYPKYVQAMRLLDDGRSIYYIEKHMGLDRKAVKLARRRYLLGGEIALLSPQHQPQWTMERKLEIVLEVEQK